MTRRIVRNGVIATIGPAPSERKQFAMLPWFPSSFMSSTRGWPLTAKGIYRELLDVQWEQGGLPADAADLRELVGATPQEWRHWPRVESKFPLGADGLRRNARLEAHRAKALERSNKAADSARQKWERERAAAQGGDHANA